MIRQMEETRTHTKFYEDPIWGHDRTAQVQWKRYVSGRHENYRESYAVGRRSHESELRLGPLRQASCNLYNLFSPSERLSDDMQNVNKLESIKLIFMPYRMQANWKCVKLLLRFILWRQVLTGPAPSGHIHIWAYHCFSSSVTLSVNMTTAVFTEILE
jgi:hypothetical protein